MFLICKVHVDVLGSGNVLLCNLRKCGDVSIGSMIENGRFGGII